MLGIKPPVRTVCSTEQSGNWCARSLSMDCTASSTESKAFWDPPRLECPASAKSRRGKAAFSSPGNASYSANRPIVGLPFPYRAVNAVGNPPAARSTINPLLSHQSANKLEDCRSSIPISARDQSWRETSIISILMSSQD